MQKITLGGLFLVWAFLFALVVVFSNVFNVNFNEIKSIVNSFGIFAPLIYTLILFLGLSIPFNPVPDIATVNVAALLFTPEVSVPATFAAHSMALIVNYFIGRNCAKWILKKIIGKNEFSSVENLASKLNLRTIFGLRFILPFSTALGFDLISYVAGMEKIRFDKFFLASIIPWTILNIIYFHATDYFKSQSILLFFLPALLLVGAPALLLFVGKKFKSPK